MILRLWTPALFAGLFAIAACEQPPPEGCEREPALDYDNFGRGFMEQFCAGCHSSLVPTNHRNNAPPGLDFDHYEAVLTFAERIEARVAEPDPGRAMPPGGGPTDAERARLVEWIQCRVMADKAEWEASR